MFLDILILLDFLGKLFQIFLKKIIVLVYGKIMMKMKKLKMKKKLRKKRKKMIQNKINCVFGMIIMLILKKIIWKVN